MKTFLVVLMAYINISSINAKTKIKGYAVAAKRAGICSRTDYVVRMNGRTAFCEPCL